MAQGGPGWDDSLCLSCQKPAVRWPLLQAKKRVVFSTEYGREHVLAALRADSPFRRQAVDQVCGVRCARCAHALTHGLGHAATVPVVGLDVARGALAGGRHTRLVLRH